MKHSTSRVLVAAVWALSIAAASCVADTRGDGERTEADLAAAAASVGAAITGVQSGRCLDVTGNSAAAGTPLIIYDCNGQANQRFVFTANGELRALDGTVCVQAENGATASGTRAVIAACNGQVGQQWRRNASGTITSAQTSLCLDVKGNKTENLTPVQAYRCNGGANQRFTTAAPVDTTPPTPPTNLRISGVTCTSATLAWSASTDDVGVAFYDVYHDGQLLQSVPGATLTAAVTVVPGVTWGFFVNARDAAGNVSQASITVPLTPPQCQVDTVPPTVPANVAATASGTSVTVTWTASTDDVGVKAYDVYRDGATKVGTVLGSGSTPPATAFVDSGLAPVTSYSYSVLARDAQGNASAKSAAAHVTTGQACTGAICSTTEITTDTDIPWGLVSLADGSVLYARRDAQDIVRVDPANGQKTTVGTVPGVQGTDGEGGLMGLAIGPGFATDRWLYVMHTSATDNRIVRMKYTTAQKLDTSTLQVLVSGLLRNKFHNGGRLRMGPDGKLYASTGDAQNGANAQSLSGLNGKVLRMNTDGTVPGDNPFGTLVWSYGHRNPQGLAFDSQGRLWEQEFGNSAIR